MADWSALVAQKRQAKQPTQGESTTPVSSKWSDLVKRKRAATEQPVISPEIKKEKQPRISVEGEAPFEAHAVAGASSKPEQIIRAYAKHRFPTLSTEDAAKRYYMKDGEVWYIDNDGIERQEQRETGLGKAIEDIDPSKINVKRLAARGLTELPPALVGGSVQIATGSPYAAAGAAGLARGVETGIAQLLADREPEYKEMLTAGGTEAVATILGDFIAKKGIKAFDSIRNAAATGEQKIIQKAVGEDIPGLKLPESQAAIQQIAEIAEKHNIPIDMAQLLQSQEAAALQKSILQSGGAGAEILKEHGKQTAEATHRALKEELELIAPGAKSKYETGRGLVETAGEARQSLVDIRGKESGAKYTEAFEKPIPVDIAPVVNNIDTAIKNDVARGGETAKALQRIRGMLVQDAPADHPIVKQIDDALSREVGPTAFASQLKEARRELTQNAGLLEDRLKKLNSAKIEIDKIINGPKSENIPGEELINLGKIKDQIVKQMDKENPIYQEARATYQRLSAPIDAFDKTILDVVRKLEGDNVVKAPNRIFSNEMSDPATIRTAKKFIQKQNPQIWDSAVRVFMEQELGKVKDVMSGRSLAEGFRKKVWSPEMRERMRAALDPSKFRQMDEFMGLIKKLGISIDANSDTALKQMATERRRRLAGGKTSQVLRTAGKVTDFLKGNLKEIANELELAKDPEFSRKLALAFTSKDIEIIRAVNRLKKINPKTEKFIRAFAAFSSDLVGRTGYEKLQTDTYGSKEDVIKYLEGPE
jgi:hypothetical protein